MTTTNLSFSAVPTVAVVGDNSNSAAVSAALDAAIADYDTIAAAICVITGDTYSDTTHHFTTGGATGLTHAQFATQATALNAVLDALVAAVASVDGASGDFSVAVNSSAFTTKGQLKAALDNAADVLGQLLNIR